MIGLAVSQHGVISSEDARDIGVDTARLRQMAARGVLRRVSRGVYRLTDMDPGTGLGQYMEAVLWPRGARGVLSHETALDLHDLCDVNPSRIDVTVPASHRPHSREVPAVIRLHRRDLGRDEVTDLRGLPIVTPVRAILDGIESQVRDGLLRQAISTLRQRGELRPRDEERVFAALYARSRGEPSDALSPRQTSSQPERPLDVD
ncbi:MAG: type IV toxin-antitoxin system AbiEi family antitoxin domain-containing protein [Actinobacteria bacterium]|nr:type IV toxin-antitoxin system AbiEi family antitoxin domain-containing protein [Actinomycetota bacterium]